MERITKDELERRVDEVLFYAWDPIGMKDEPCARAEYRSYVDSILRLLQKNSSAEEIATHLSRIQTESMGLHSNFDHNLAIANILLQHKVALDDGLA